jgi:hypothetical protein
MATYYGTYGQKVQYLASDPSDPQIGQVWYNSTSATLKVRAFITAAWATGGTMNTAREQVNGAGLQTAMIIAGGSPLRNAAESYDGTSWTTVANYPVGSEAIGVCGTQTSALAFGGFRGPPQLSSNVTNSWNGSSWTTLNSLNTARYATGEVGGVGAALAWGGDALPGARVSTPTESWNGTSWTTVNNLGTAMYYSAAAGDTSSALAFGGNFPSPPATVNQTWDGTSWSTPPANLTTQMGNGFGFGSVSTAAIAASGNNAGTPLTLTQSYNGTSWTNLPQTVSTARSVGASAGSQSSGIIAGGDVNPGSTGATEEWTGSGFSTKTITTS